MTQQICSHHRRRLGKIGWEHALDAPSGGWAATDSAPPEGNNVDVMIDGAQAQALPTIADQMRQSKSLIHVTQRLEPLEPAVRAIDGNVGRRLRVATKHLGYDGVVPRPHRIDCHSSRITRQRCRPPGDRRLCATETV